MKNHSPGHAPGNHLFHARKKSGLSQQEVDVSCHEAEPEKLLQELEKKYGYGELDSFLVVKDILASVWKNRQKKRFGGRLIFQ